MKQNRLFSHSVYSLVFLGLLWLLAACTPLIRPPAAEPLQGNVPQDAEPAIEHVRQSLGQELNVDATAILVVNAEAILWPDACLGAPAADEMCAQVQTPGYRLTLAVNGNEYLYHTNADGSVVRQASAPTETGAAPGSAPTMFYVESVEVHILKSNPVQVEAMVRGQLVDACTTLQDAMVEPKQKTFVITLQPTRPADQMCAQVLTPFEQVVPLEMPDPTTGTYAVQVGDVIKSFTLGE